MGIYKINENEQFERWSPNKLVNKKNFQKQGNPEIHQIMKQNSAFVDSQIQIRWHFSKEHNQVNVLRCIRLMYEDDVEKSQVQDQFIHGNSNEDEQSKIQIQAI